MFFSVPAELEFVRTSTVDLSHITIQWGLLPCIKQNGDIIGYMVTWGKNNLNVTGANAPQVTIMNLAVSAIYSFKVAAVNTVGTGPFKTLIAATLGMLVLPLIL